MKLRFVLLCTALAAATLLNAQDSSTAKMDSTPDFQQVQGGFPGGGKQFCGPVAVSNSFVELAQNGWPALLPSGVHGRQAQIALILALASPDLMNTNLDDGTSTSSLLHGVEAWVRRTPYRLRYFKYEGFHRVSDAYHAGTIPDTEWFKRGIRDPDGAVWINIGWYRRDPASDSWYRIGGHWVTLVGYGMDSAGRPAPDILVIHNPWRHPRQTAANDFVTMNEIPSGWLINGEPRNLSGLPRKAKGYFALTGEIYPKKGTDTAIIDGAVVMSLGK